MKVILSRNLIAPDNGTPIVRVLEEGIDIPDMVVLQYENIRAQYIAIRDNLIGVYREAGGEY
jgi:hypothetical protein